MTVVARESLEVAGVSIQHPDEVFVGGAWEPGDGGTYDVISPATEGIVAQVQRAGSGNAAHAVDVAADQGLKKWATLPVDERVAVVRRFCERMEAQLPDMERVWAVEAGFAVRYSRTLHRFGAIGAWQTALDVAENVLAPQHRESPLGRVVVSHEPAGVVFAIMSYNGPLVTIASKVVPALLAGCPVIVKFAQESQLVLRMVSQAAAEAGFPAGAISLLGASAAVGQTISENPLVDVVSLTGGSGAAHQIIEATSPRFARTHLELGGKSAAVILEDADLDQALRSLVPGATGGTGQVCAILSRIVVPASRHDELIERLKQAWEALPIGDPLDPQVKVGPMSNPAAIERTKGFVERAIADGATLVTGGGRPEGFDRGWYYRPTLITDVAPDSDLAHNEVFGPVTAVLTYTDVNEAIAIANGTQFGLSASVYTTDEARGLEVARQIQAGSVAINTFGPTLTAPFGGVKGSGWGREAGPEGILEFTELKQVVVAPA
jgi:acyl-CoA reductase-like NAD-dependent aldehyde dehydrogenase